MKIMINQELQTFSHEPLKVNDRILVPLRGVFETLEATTNWNSDTNDIEVSTSDKLIALTVGQHDALVNEQHYILDVVPMIKDNRTYVPLRFVAQAIGAKVEWNPELQMISICTDGCEKGEVLVSGLAIGDSAIEMKKMLGEPQEILPSKYHFDWYIYHHHYKDFLKIGVDNTNTIVAFYTNHDLIALANGQVKLGTTKAEVHRYVGEPVTEIIKGNRSYQFRSKGEWDLFLLENSYYVTLFYDLHENERVTGMQVIKKELELEASGFYGLTSEELITSYEKQLYHLTNAIRARYALPLLTWSEKAALAARNHSIDMAENDYFSHTSISGKSPFQRMREVGIEYRYAGENLAVGQFSAIFAHEGLMNSAGHRANILQENYQNLGIGVSFRNQRPYFTEKFFAP